jgi:hypothetical protein
MIVSEANASFADKAGKLLFAISHPPTLAKSRAFLQVFAASVAR